MEYFDFYGIPVSFLLDENFLKKQFLKKSREFHPDFYTQESEQKQEEILKSSTFNNTAYKVLKDFDLRTKYILTNRETLLGEGQDKMDQSFLMEMMEINEALMELKFDPNEADTKKLTAQIEAFEKSLKDDVQPFLEKDYNALSQDDLESIKQYYLKNKYLKRLKENLNNTEPDL